MPRPLRIYKEGQKRAVSKAQARDIADAIRCLKRNMPQTAFRMVFNRSTVTTTNAANGPIWIDCERFDNIEAMLRAFEEK